MKYLSWGLAPLLMLLLFVGCTEEQVARAESAVVQTGEMLQQSEQALLAAHKAIETAEAVAVALDNEKALEAVVTAKKAMVVANQTHESLTIAHKQAEKTLELVKAAEGSKWSTIELVLGIVSTVVPALAAVGGVWKNGSKWKAAAITSAQLAQDLKPLAKKFDAGGVEQAIKIASAKQIAAHVQDRVDGIRRG